MLLSNSNKQGFKTDSWCQTSFPGNDGVVCFPPAKRGELRTPTKSAIDRPLGSNVWSKVGDSLEYS